MATQTFLDIFELPSPLSETANETSVPFSSQSPTGFEPAPNR